MQNGPRAAFNPSAGRAALLSSVLSPILDAGEGAVRQCPACATENADDARFCRGCGQSLQAACPRCATPHAADARFCLSCGTPLVAERVCASCSQTNTSDARFCRACGASFGSTGTISAGRTSVGTLSGEQTISSSAPPCPSCGLVNAPAAAFCLRCGQRLGSSPSSGLQPTLTSGETRIVQARDLVGRELNGYRFERKLGEGGMGAVFLATHLRLQRAVACKVLPPALARDRKLIERFEREARALASVVHPGIVPIHDMFESAGLYCIVMAYAGGGSLAERLARGPLEPQQVVSWGAIAARALWAAAQKGIVHRDVKPDNLLLTEEGRLLVADFGLARAAEEASALTRTGSLMGTPAYMAPEQWENAHTADHRSDLYSLGCTLYHLLTGRPPFPGPATSHFIKQHLLEPPPPPRGLRPELSPELEAIVLRLLAKRPEDRFPDGEALARGLLAAPATGGPPLPQGLGELFDSARLPKAPPPPAPPRPVTREPAPPPAPPPPATREPAPPPRVQAAFRREHVGGVGEAPPPPPPQESARQTSPPPPPPPPPRNAPPPRSAPPPRKAPAAPAPTPAAAAEAPAGKRNCGCCLVGLLLVLGLVGYQFQTELQALYEELTQPPLPLHDPDGRAYWWTPAPLQADLRRDGQTLTWDSPGGLTFVRIPAGRQYLGASADDPGRRVDETLRPFVLEEPLWMLATELSRGMAFTIYGQAADGFPHVPLTGITYFDALAICNQLSLNEGLPLYYELAPFETSPQGSILNAWVEIPDPDGPGYRLPTEDEWEYACRAGTRTPWSTGAALSGQACFAASEISTISLFPANGFGLYDIHGNAAEWCQADDLGLGLGEVFTRGGSYADNAADCRSSRRFGFPPDTRSAAIGFRCVRPARPLVGVAPQPLEDGGKY